ncbi:MAG: hypothetical protein A3C90_04245 [Candidatus Magasanikbacteria bacterium RIFCSPHIGHO2_02_FULL_51_14]|uniref:VanZ-like domain-containing protein n=1 Tax=Candidatus Magasanikbacteria bacterium RIFCSPHIGHO2_02_FULL_51_14 TaxID=1798683 RepID=A0A1F6MGB0_9BACT|nr:MAG: hypothetical protein A3C90_04245 [Candidatus Magasanikbacteria bacterium RIFCSPHIGHO2_02_FULL_51_14]
MSFNILLVISPMIAVYALNIFLYTAFGLTEELWFSMPMHALGGFVTAWSAANVYGLVKEKNRLSIKPFFLFVFFLIGTTAIIGILWEVYEFISDVIAPFAVELTLADTLTDLLMDMLGGAVFALSLGKRWQRNRST